MDIQLLSQGFVSACRSGIQRLVLGALPMLGLYCLLGCGGDTSVIGRETPTSCDLADYEGDQGLTNVTVATFWAADDNERRALEVLSARVGELGHKAAAGLVHQDRAEAQETLNVWIRDDGKLPDVYQANGGSDVLQYVAEPPEASAVCALNELDERYGWRERYFEAAIAPSSCDQQLYALPLGVHRLNVLFYNKQMMSEVQQRGAELDRSVPEPGELKSVDEFLNLLETVHEWGLTGNDGDTLVPLALGRTSPWPILILAFENLLAAYQGNVYEKVWLGAGGNGDPALAGELEKLAAHLERVGAVSNLGEPISWQRAVQDVAEGNALFTVMGDWGWAQVDTMYRDMVSAVPFPGTRGTYVYTPDSFTAPRFGAPRQAGNGAEAHLWLREVIDHPETQLEFARVKQCIPAMKGLLGKDLEMLDSAYLEESYAEFTDCQNDDSDCRLLLAVSGLGPPPGVDVCHDEMGLLLSQIAGFPWDNGTECFDEPPKNREEATEAMVEILLRISQERFAAHCRP